MQLLLEIGTEEIPAGWLPGLLEELRRRALDALEGAGLRPRALRTLGTPRRLVLMVDGLPPRQPERQREVWGPPREIAFDAEGRPTKAALGFARKVGLPLEELELRRRERGEFLCARLTEGGRPVGEVLAELLPGVVLSLSTPKSMRWDDTGVRFARPIRWVLCLLEGEVLGVALGGMAAGRHTRGHRQLSPGPHPVAHPAEYLELMERVGVTVDPELRRRRILEELEALAAEVGGRPVVDQQLLETVVWMTEHPRALRGDFAPEFLQLPREVIVAVMQHHQRCFPVEGQDGQLLPHFLVVANLPPSPAVTRGNERVLRARLADARFFLQEDLKRPLADRLEELRGVVFQERLGSMYDKAMRLEELARWLARRLAPGMEARAGRAARLCKADLVTEMVKELPELQGVMGGYYARLQGEDPEVARAISEHYRMQPEGLLGALVSLADRADTLVGLLGVGIRPRGSADPYGLRRQALGMIQALLRHRLRLRLGELLGHAAALYGGRLRPEAVEEALGFLRGRLQALLRQRMEHGTVEAVLASGFDDPVDAWRRAEALHRFRQEDGFEALTTSFKRAANIVRAAPVQIPSSVRPQLLREEAERLLFERFQRVRAQVEAQLEAEDYLGALRTLAGLRPEVDRFFDEVLVMTPQEELRDNRLALLQGIEACFRRIADLSQLGA